MPLTETDNQCYFDQHKAREKHCASWLTTQSKTVQKPIVLSALAGIINGVLIIAQAGLLATLLSTLVINGSKTALAVNSPIIEAIGLLIIVILLRAVCVYSQQTIGFKAGARIRTAIRQQLTDTFATQGVSALKQQHSGALASVSLEQVDALAPYFSRYLPQHYIVGILPFIMLAVVFPINWLVGLILLFTAPLIPLFMALVGMGAVSAQRSQFLALSRMSGYFLDRLQGLATLKLFGQAEQELKAIHQVADSFRANTMNVLRLAFLSSAVLEFFSAIAVALVAVYVGFSLLGQIPSAPTISFKVGLFVLLLAPEFFTPLRQLAVFYHDKAAALAAADAILGVLENVGWGEERTPITHAPCWDSQSSPQATIEFHQVSKTYDQRQVLSNITIQIQQGEKIALVGASGAGKTTLLNLLLGFETASSGDIYLDGQPLTRDYATQHIAYIGQAAYMFYGSISDNIALANPNASTEQINTAAFAAGVTEFSDNLKDGLQTLVGERGYGLSGGQVQRIAVARALLKNTDIIVLDEPTANLDKATKTLLLENFQQLFKNKTVLIASHDDELIQGMERKIVLQNGCLS